MTTVVTAYQVGKLRNCEDIFIIVFLLFCNLRTCSTKYATKKWSLNGDRVSLAEIIQKKPKTLSLVLELNNCLGH